MVLQYRMLPAVLTLHDIKCDPQDPCAGGFANVWCGTYDNSKVAVKVLRVQAGMTEEDRIKRDQVRHPVSVSNIVLMIVTKAFLREILLWTGLSHPHIVPFLGISTDIFFLRATENTPARIGLVIPWLEKGSVRQYLHMQRTKGSLSEAQMPELFNRWESVYMLQCMNLLV